MTKDSAYAPEDIMHMVIGDLQERSESGLAAIDIDSGEDPALVQTYRKTLDLCLELRGLIEERGGVHINLRHASKIKGEPQLSKGPALFTHKGEEVRATMVHSFVPCGEHGGECSVWRKPGGEDFHVSRKQWDTGVVK